MFNVEKVTEDCIKWIKEWFDINGPTCNAIIGLSGGKDSTIVAALCAKALGPDRVVGIALPDYGQSVNEADQIAEYLGIKYLEVPIGSITSSFDNAEWFINQKWSEQAEQNIPPRVRMTMLYAIAQTLNGRVSCNCNLSEDYLGYSTLFGDSAGSFAPIAQLTVTELLQIGDYLGIPKEWVHKTPDDGLPNSMEDEEKFGFSYEELDRYIREGIEPSGDCGYIAKIDKIKVLHKRGKFKTDIIKVPCFIP